MCTAEVALANHAELCGYIYSCQSSRILERIGKDGVNLRNTTSLSDTYLRNVGRNLTLHVREVEDQVIRNLDYNSQCLTVNLP